MLSRSVKANPFYQPCQQWQIRIVTERNLMMDIGDAFEDIALATLHFERVEDGEEWCVDIITDHLPEPGDIEARLALASGLLGIPTPAYEVQELRAHDWLEEVENSFPPLNIGRFYVHGSHIRTTPPVGKIALQVSAGAAFGSGEHATTSGCLLALQYLAKHRRFLRPLDMGCGSGILALAMAKLWCVNVTAVDIDPVSVKVARGNATKNRLTRFLRWGAGDGYHATLARKHAPYDIIVANILARPLMKMAKQLAAVLDKNGYAVLSGLLVSQERMVLAAHQRQGLKLAYRIRQNGWSTLVLCF